VRIGRWLGEMGMGMNGGILRLGVGVRGRERMMRIKKEVRKEGFLIRMVDLAEVREVELCVSFMNSM